MDDRRSLAARVGWVGGDMNRELARVEGSRTGRKMRLN